MRGFVYLYFEEAEEHDWICCSWSFVEMLIGGAEVDREIWRTSILIKLEHNL